MGLVKDILCQMRRRKATLLTSSAQRCWPPLSSLTIKEFLSEQISLVTMSVTNSAITCSKRTELSEAALDCSTKVAQQLCFPAELTGVATEVCWGVRLGFSSLFWHQECLVFWGLRLLFMVGRSVQSTSRRHLCDRETLDALYPVSLKVPMLPWKHFQCWPDWWCTDTLLSCTSHSWKTTSRNKLDWAGKKKLEIQTFWHRTKHVNIIFWPIGNSDVLT